MFRISTRHFLPKVPIYVKGRTLYCEFPSTEAEKQQGLKGRDILFEHQGMLFDVSSRYQPLFTMSDVKFDLEAIFIGNDRKIKDIVPMRKMDGSTAYTTPLRIPIRFVIEMNKGYCSKYGIELGDVVRIN